MGFLPAEPSLWVYAKALLVWRPLWVEQVTAASPEAVGRDLEEKDKCLTLCSDVVVGSVVTLRKKEEETFQERFMKAQNLQMVTGGSELGRVLEHFSRRKPWYSHPHS